MTQPHRPDVQVGDAVIIRSKVVSVTPDGKYLLQILPQTHTGMSNWPNTVTVSEDQIHEHEPAVTPDEPPLGPYLIGGHCCMRVDARKGWSPWLWERPQQQPDGSGWMAGTWDEVWRECGGPDVKIQRLVPESGVSVRLPWFGGDKRGAHLGVNNPGKYDSVILTVDFDDHHLTQAVARGMAFALLEAAGRVNKRDNADAVDL